MDEQIFNAAETFVVQKSWQTNLCKANSILVDENIVSGVS